MQRCKCCGLEVEDDLNICPHCGANIPHTEKPILQEEENSKSLIYRRIKFREGEYKASYNKEKRFEKKQYLSFVCNTLFMTLMYIVLAAFVGYVIFGFWLLFIENGVPFSSVFSEIHRNIIHFWELSGYERLFVTKYYVIPGAICAIALLVLNSLKKDQISKDLKYAKYHIEKQGGMVWEYSRKRGVLVYELHGKNCALRRKRTCPKKNKGVETKIV